MKHPKTCNGCKALYQSQYSFLCDLGYKLKIVRRRSVKGTDIMNVSPEKGTCPKPLTNKELLDAPHEKR